MRKILPWLVLPLLLAGCELLSEQTRKEWGLQPDDAKSSTLLVPDKPFDLASTTPKAVMQAAYQPAAPEDAVRVDAIGRNILAANPKAGARPLFVTYGSPAVELFHRGTNEVVITAGLVRQCTTDSQLAAVLCYEMGRMMADRAVQANPAAKPLDRGPPMDVRLDRDSTLAGSSDQTLMAEVGFYERERQQQKMAAQLPPDPNALARTYLTAAGYPPTELDAVAPLLQTATNSAAVQKQLAPPTPARPWTY